MVARCIYTRYDGCMSSLNAQQQQAMDDYFRCAAIEIGEAAHEASKGIADAIAKFESSRGE